jgi:hypothetical protein
LTAKFVEVALPVAKQALADAISDMVTSSLISLPVKRHFEPVHDFENPANMARSVAVHSFHVQRQKILNLSHVRLSLLCVPIWYFYFFKNSSNR